MNSLLKAISNASKEVWINWFDISPGDLQQIIKASYRTERLIFCQCNIYLSHPLDFSICSKYNIKFLSFYYCGDSERTSDFLIDPACFESIIEAIAKSGLRFSLEKLDIYWCLDKSIVQEMFKKIWNGSNSSWLFWIRPTWRLV